MNSNSRCAVAWFCLAGLLACEDKAGGSGATAAHAAAAPAAAPRKVELVHAVLSPLEESVAISGTLAAQDQVAVRSKVSGKLASIEVDLGSVVRAGQVIAQVEPIDYRLRVEQAVASLAQAKALVGLASEEGRADVVVDEMASMREARATLDEARANLERSRTLLDKKLIGRADFEGAQATYLRAESDLARAREEVFGRLAVLKQRSAEVALARQQLLDTAIRSPLDGVVQLRSASAGELLAEGAAVATVVRVDPLRLRVEIPEREAARVAAGQRVVVRVDEEERAYEGRVARLAPALNAQNRTLTVEAEIPNPGSLRPGSFARAVISLGEGAPAVTVPKSAVVVFAGLEKVVVVEQGKAVEKSIRTGRKLAERVEVIEGLVAGDAVVLEPGTLQQGQAVEVTGVRPAPSIVPAGERDLRSK